MNLDNNVQIVSLYFSEYSYGWPEESYEYYFKKNKGWINYTFYGKGMAPSVNVSNNEKFSKQVLDIVENWKRKYYWEYTICDGTIWELKIRLSNGKYIRSEGHQKFPNNYKRLQGYLNRFVGKYAKQFKEDYLKYLY